ncbi:MAG: LysR family transcriptional regulator [Sandaracinus sp.]|nr:LysR family transcriptional regulator [Sandaracinus sp.]
MSEIGTFRAKSFEISDTVPVAPTLDQLRTLEAIDRLGSFAAAGKELHRTTSAVSYAVQKLEESLGLPLFDRSGHRARLTEAGRLMTDAGRRVLAEARSLEDLARQLRGEWEPELRIVVDGIFPLRPVLRAARSLTEARAPTRVQLRVEFLGGVRERFENAPADLMLTLEFAGDPDHEARALDPIEMILVTRPEHPLQALARVDRADLTAHVELTVRDSSRRRPPRGPLDMGSTQRFRLSDFHSKREALVEGVGYGWMPEHLVADDLRAGRLRELPLIEGSRHVFTPHLVHRRSAPLGPAGRLFVRNQLALGTHLPTCASGRPNAP